MAEGQDLVLGGEQDRVFADDAAGPDRGEADLAALALALNPVIGFGLHVRQIGEPTLGGGFAQHQGGARRGIDLAAMMGLGDLDVPVLGVQPLGRVLDQADQYVHAQREIAAFDDGDLFGGLHQLGLLFRREAGRADDQAGAAAFRSILGQGQRSVRRREVDDHVAQRDVGRFAPVETGGDDHVLARVQHLGNRATHPAAIAGYAGVEDGAQAAFSFDPSAS